MEKNPPVARTDIGTFRGVTDDGAAAWLGIPYGRVPQRFAAPVPAPPVDMVSACERGPAAWQPGPGPRPPIVRFDEQCLSLNVFAPAAAAPDRPVAVWIHGGGYIGGGSAQPDFDGAALATAEDILVVSVNYRLGALGFLDVRGLPDPHPRAERHAPVSNAGLRDILLALSWVRDHISGFGGDPGRVTIFGQSAGAHAVCALASTPQARGLFARAIAQSPPPVAITPDDARRVAEVTLREAGASSVVELGAVPPDRLIAASLLAYAQIADRSPGVLGSAPVIDGDLLEGEPLAVLASGRGLAVPLLIGSNRDEMTAFGEDRLIRSDERALAHLGRPAVPPELVGDRPGRDEATERWFRLPALAAASGHAGRASAWAYEFAYVPSGFGPVHRGGAGATHGIEAGFIFGNTDRGMWNWLAPGGPSVGDLAMLSRMRHAWGAFIRDGDPGWEEIRAGGVHALG
ncbi:carboxylesterase family protein [Microbacterium sp. 69-10]|uniref:carboxylesterase/lipase family protein n=1 Tax=Microbacterium sp. 69-10 TaxID=1895783 RepID=UPI0025DF45F8|nr:carboxylesterase family protein [Microbacterium sp. 69-10]